jgi:hypothetical protein
MANNLNLPDPAELTGVWELFVKQQFVKQQPVKQQAEKPQICRIELTDTLLPEGSVRAVKSDACLNEMLEKIMPEKTVPGKTIAGWRSEPDGIALTDAEGYSLAFFGQETEQWVAYLADGRELVMVFKNKF